MTSNEFNKIIKSADSFTFKSIELTDTFKINESIDKPLETLEKGIIKFIGCRINGLHFYSINFKNLVFENCIIYEMTFNNVKCEQLSISEHTRLNKILFEDTCKIRCIYIYNTTLIDDYLEINNLNIETLLLSGTVRKAFIDAKICLLEIRSLKAIDYVKFINLEAFDTRFIKAIQIYESNTKLIFSSCKFESYYEINLENTDLSNVDFFKCLPINISVSSSFNPLSKQEQYTHKREYYKQVKNVFSKNNDFINRLIFQRLELESYRKSLSFNLKNIGTLILLYLNKFSNYYGTNWVQGILFTLIVGIIFFVLYGIISSCLFKPFQLDILLKHFTTFLNPTHQFNFCIEVPSGIAILIDSISRLFISYGYYQTIQAFRIYGRN